jgi:hypothetical protein
VSLSHFDVLIDSKVWNKVIFLWTLFLHFLEINNPFMSILLFRPVKTVERGVDITVSSKVWNKVVHWVWGLSSISSIIATSRRAGWIRFSRDFSFCLDI